MNALVLSAVLAATPITLEQVRQESRNNLQALLGHEIGETVSLNTEHDTAQLTIVSIAPAPPDQGTAAPTIPSESAVETAIAE